MTFGIDLETQLFMPKEVVWDRNIKYWENFLKKTVPDTTETYGCDTDYSFEEKGGLFLPRQVNKPEQNSYESSAVMENIKPNSRTDILTRAAVAGFIVGELLYSIACTRPQPPVTPPTQPVPAPTPTPTPEPTPVDNPPEILSHYIPQEVNADQEFQGTANVTDDYGIERVYVVFRNGEKLETIMERADGEYRARLRLPSKGEYWYSIGARDTKGQEAKPVEDKMIVLPALDSDEDGDGFTWEQEMKQGTDPNKPDLNLKYVIDKGLFPTYIELEQIKQMDEDGKQDESEKLTLDTAYEILQSNVSDTAKKDNIIYLLSKPSEFLDAYKTLKAVSDNNTTLKNYLQRGINEEVIKYIAFLNSLANKQFAQEALIKKLGIELPVEMQVKFLTEPEKNKEEVLNYLYNEISKINPELAKEPDSIFKFSKKTTLEKAEIVEDVLGMGKDVLDPAIYKKIFDTTIGSMLNEGIKGKRGIWTPGLALIEALYGNEVEYLEREKPYASLFPEYSPTYKNVRLFYGFRDLPLMRFVAYSLDKTFKTMSFDDAVKILNTPDLLSVYWGSNVGRWNYVNHYGVLSPLESFNKMSGDCEDYSYFNLYFLIKNGYNYNNFNQYENDAAVGMAVFWDPTKPFVGGDAVILYKRDNLFYNLSFATIIGPFKTIEEAVNSVSSSWKMYRFHDGNWNVTKTVYRQ